MFQGHTGSRRDMLRRVISIAAITPVLAACDLLNREPLPPPPPDPLTPLHAATVALAARYDAAIAASPQLAATLTPLRDTHLTHAKALAAVMRPAPPAGSPQPAPSAQTGTVRQAEQAGHQEAVEACLTAPPYRAVLLAEIAAARACHLEVLPRD